MSVRATCRPSVRPIVSPLARNGVSGGSVTPNRGLVVGDSTVATYNSNPGIHLLVLSKAETNAGFVLDSIAVPGDTIADQKTDWVAYADKLLLDYVIVEVGLNDLNPAVATATTIAAYQDLIDTIRAGVSSSCLIMLQTMTPCYERFADVGYDPTLGQAKWVAVNDAIMGRGSSPITGADIREEAHTIALSMDVSGNAALATIYDNGDHIHPNKYGRSVIGKYTRENLLGLNMVYSLNEAEPVLYTPTLLQWVSAQDAASVLTSTGPDVVAGNGDAVAKWSDLSGNAIHFTQTANHPTLQTLGATSYKAIRFNGTTNFLQATLSPSFLRNVGAAFFVINTTDNSHSLWHNGTDLNKFVYLALQGNGTGGLNAGSRVWINGVEIFSTSKGDLYTAMNGAPVVVAVAGPLAFSQFTNTANAFRIGLFNLGLYQFTGDLAESIIYDSIPLEANIDAINAYLISKYA